jgi:hypothetical protein
VKGVLQSYEALNDIKAGNELDVILVVSVLFSMNSIAIVLLLFVHGKLDSQSSIGYKLCLYLGHVAEVGFRTLSLALLGFAIHRYSFVAVAACLGIRFALYSGKGLTSKNMHISMVFASVLIDSVWTDRMCLCYASALTAIEGALFALGTYYLEADFWNQHGTLLLCLMCSTLLIKTASQLLCAALTTKTSHKDKVVKGKADQDEAGLAIAVLGVVSVI